MRCWHTRFFALLSFTLILSCPLSAIGTTLSNQFEPILDQLQVSPVQTPQLIAKSSKKPKKKSKKSKAPTINIPQEMVDAHNKWRSQVGVPPLQWSPTLAAYAQDWANQLASRGKFEHRPADGYGENLFMITGGKTSPSKVVDGWASERSNYNYATNTCQGVCGHYTQIVWRNTTEVGCAVAHTKIDEIWVCNYNPPGNYIGQSPY